MEPLIKPQDFSQDQELIQKIKVPQEKGITFKKFFAFLGPGFLVSIAYLDPGNIESDLRTGTLAGYKLLWLLLLSTILGAVLQRLALRLGVVTGKDLAQNCRLYLPKAVNITTWIMVELVIVGSDMQEVIGTSIALYILSRQKIPLYAGVIITVFDTFIFLLVDRYGFRKLEFLFASGVLLMGIMFGYLYIVSGPNQEQIIQGMFEPLCKNCGYDALIQAVGIVGAVIMPHNIYLHSSLTETREIDRSKDSNIREANFLFFLESSTLLLISFVINLFVVATFASAYYDSAESSQKIYNQCIARNIPDGEIFKNMTDARNMNIYSGSVFLGCKFGIVTTYIWAVGILAAGQTSTMAGTYTGQYVMEGFLKIKWNPWKRLLVTRIIAIGPTIVVALFQGLDKLTVFNDLLNVLMSIQLPFALVPVVALTSSPKIMGKQFVNRKISKVIYTALILLIIGINIYSIVDIIRHYTEGHVFYQFLIVFIMVVYFVIIFYITISFMAISETIRLGKYSRFFVKDAVIQQSDD